MLEVLCFIDYAKAFNFIKWSHLFKVLRKTRVSKSNGSGGVIIHVYEYNLIMVRINIEDLKIFKQMEGVRQDAKYYVAIQHLHRAG